MDVYRLIVDGSKRKIFVGVPPGLSSSGVLLYLAEMYHIPPEIFEKDVRIGLEVTNQDGKFLSSRLFSEVVMDKVVALKLAKENQQLAHALAHHQNELTTTLKPMQVERIVNALISTGNVIEHLVKQGIFPEATCPTNCDENPISATPSS